MSEWPRGIRTATVPRTRGTLRVVSVGLCVFMLTVSGIGQQGMPDLTTLSLDALSAMDIMSVSRKEEKLADAAAAAFVITSEDIRRSGMETIPELLRLVPGLDVAQIDANKWSITARGFGERFPDKMLVLMDGRTLYSPLTSGVNWDVQETLLEDVERIEVIRGPGATLWGSNAVNAVVNIITKNAKNTTGVLVSGDASLHERSLGAARYGSSLGTGSSRLKGAYRIFGKYFDRSGTPLPGDGRAPDGWHDLRGGFRTDVDLSQTSALVLQGDLFRGHSGGTADGILPFSPASSGTFVNGTFVDGTRTSGGNVLGRWTKISGGLDTTVLAYFDLENRGSSVLGEYRHTVDAEMVQRHRVWQRHDLIWGGDFRSSADRTVGSLNISYNPARQRTELYGAFIQDETAFLDDRLKITFGNKVEHNHFSGFSFQPNLRMIWIPSERVSTWMAISRASESSSRTDSDVRTNQDPGRLPDGTITMVSQFGTNHLPPENVTAYELGNRFQPNHVVSFDTAAFYNRYSNRHTNEPGTPYLESTPAPVHLVIPFYKASNIHGETHGLELLARVQVRAGWKLSGSYSLFQIHLHQSASSQDFETAPESEGSSPRQEFQAHSLINLSKTLELDSAVYRVGRLEAPGIDGYTRFDVRVGWRPTAGLEFSAAGRNLLQASHYEFGSGDLVHAEPIGRSVSVKTTWRF